MQDRIKFNFSSEQCELLAAFEAAGSLTELAKMMHRDVSVVSRNLQVLADSGVVVKVNHRWSLTPLGRQVNNWTKTVVISQARIFDQQLKTRSANAQLPAIGADTALLLVGLQNGFQDSCWGIRNNLDAEQKIHELRTAWRQGKRKIVYIQHQSREPASPLRKGSMGASFLQELQPAADEIVIEKSSNSAFAGTDLLQQLQKNKINTLVIVGFSTNHCIDATAKSAGDAGLSVFVVSDCCVSFDRIDHEGQVVKADTIHRVVMANLNQEFATVVEFATLRTLLEDTGITE